MQHISQPIQVNTLFPENARFYQIDAQFLYHPGSLTKRVSNCHLLNQRLILTVIDEFVKQWGIIHHVGKYIIGDEVFFDSDL